MWQRVSYDIAEDQDGAAGIGFRAAAFPAHKFITDLVEYFIGPERGINPKWIIAIS